MPHTRRRYRLCIAALLPLHPHHRTRGRKSVDRTSPSPAISRFPPSAKPSYESSLGCELVRQGRRFSRRLSCSGLDGPAASRAGRAGFCSQRDRRGSYCLLGDMVSAVEFSPKLRRRVPRIGAVQGRLLGCVEVLSGAGVCCESAAGVNMPSCAAVAAQWDPSRRIASHLG